MIANDKYVNEKTAAKLLHVSTAELRKMRSLGEIAFIRHHRKVLYHVDEIDRYLAGKTVEAVKRACWKEILLPYSPESFLSWE